MILFALGMLTGAFLTFVISLAFAARNGEDRARRLREHDELRRRVRQGRNW